MGCWPKLQPLTCPKRLYILGRCAWQPNKNMVLVVSGVTPADCVTLKRSERLCQVVVVNICGLSVVLAGLCCVLGHASTVTRRCRPSCICSFKAAAAYSRAASRIRPAMYCATVHGQQMFVNTPADKLLDKGMSQWWQYACVGVKGIWHTQNQDLICANDHAYALNVHY